MSYRSRRSSDRSPYREKSHSHHSSKYDKYDDYDRNDRYDKYERRHRRESSSSRDRSDRDRDRYHSRRRGSHSSRSDKDYSKYRSRSKSPSHSSSRHHDEYSRSSHKPKDYKESKTRSDERSSSKYSSDNLAFEKYSSGASSNEMEKLSNERAPKVMESKPIAAQSKIEIQPNHSTVEYNDSNADSMDVYETYAMDENDELLEQEKQRVQRETLERLQKHLENEGKSYPAPRPQASHPIFANDGSFLEMFKSMQNTFPQPAVEAPKPVTVAPKVSQPKQLPPIMKRRGGKILKTGIVQKKRVVEETEPVAPSDSWAAYLKEVSQYKKVTCTDDNITRSLVK